MDPGLQARITETGDAIASLEMVVAELVLAKVQDERFDEDPEITTSFRQRPVTAAAKPLNTPHGGFDSHHDWHDPGSGEFAHAGVDTATGIVKEVFKHIVEDNNAGGTWLKSKDNYLSRIGVKRGEAVLVRSRGDKFGTIDVLKDGQPHEYRVSLSRFSEELPDENVTKITKPEFVGNTTAKKSGRGLVSAERIKALGDQGGTAVVSDSYLRKFGIQKGDVIPVRYGDEKHAIIRTPAGTDTQVAWSRFADDVPPAGTAPSPQVAGEPTFERVGQDVNVSFPDGSTTTLTGKQAAKPYVVVWQRSKYNDTDGWQNDPNGQWVASPAVSRRAAEKGVADIQSQDHGTSTPHILEMPDASPEPTSSGAVPVAAFTFPDVTDAWAATPNYDTTTGQFMGHEIHTVDVATGKITIMLPDGTTVQRNYKSGASVVWGRDKYTGMWDAKVQKSDRVSSFENVYGNTKYISLRDRSPVIDDMSERQKALAANSMLAYAYDAHQGLNDGARTEEASKRIDKQVKERLDSLGFGEFTPDNVARSFIDVPDPPVLDAPPPITDPDILTQRFEDMKAFQADHGVGGSGRTLIRAGWSTLLPDIVASVHARANAGDPQWNDTATLARFEAAARHLEGRMRPRFGSSSPDTIKRVDDLQQQVGGYPTWDTEAQKAYTAITNNMRESLKSLSSLHEGENRDDRLKTVGDAIAEMDAFKQSWGGTADGVNIIDSFDHPELSESDLNVLRHFYRLSDLSDFAIVADKFVTDTKFKAFSDSVTAALPGSMTRIVAGLHTLPPEISHAERVDAATRLAYQEFLRNPNLAETADLQYAVTESWSTMAMPQNVTTTEELHQQIAAYANTPGEVSDIRHGFDRASYLVWRDAAFANGRLFPTYGLLDSHEGLQNGSYRKLGISGMELTTYGLKLGDSAKPDLTMAAAEFDSALTNPAFAAQVNMWGGPAIVAFTKGSKGVAFSLVGTNLIFFSKSRATSAQKGWKHAAAATDQLGVDLMDAPVSKVLIHDLYKEADEKWAINHSAIDAALHNSDLADSAIVRHEYGHVVESRLVNAGIRRHEATAFMEYVQAHPTVRDEISTYARSNPHELFAETFEIVTHPRYKKRRGYSPEAEEAFNLFEQIIAPFNGAPLPETPIEPGVPSTPGVTTPPDFPSPLPGVPTDVGSPATDAGVDVAATPL